MNSNIGTRIEPSPGVTPRAKWLNRTFSALIFVVGLWVTGPSFDHAERQLLADRCLWPMSTTDNMPSEQISEELQECADLLGWGLGETVVKLLDRLPFFGWVVIFATFFLALGHRRLSTKWYGSTMGGWLDKRIDDHYRHDFPPPTIAEVTQRQRSEVTES
jgi:hypothetical protein